ncbi:YqxA family protein [Neobacillus niacini]|uniref:YqxA family protein n=1 Tax=Neobacillus niacini TaxID=86668 RepID=UPI0021CB4DFF|nr:YqxA family protein [Neobacillus niacini]MCM3765344.1 YqxA family protein [Neobacillus niacini]
MKMFMLKSIVIAALMFIAVLTGMELANNGIHKMKGYDDPNFQNAVSINENGQQLNATFLGDEITSHDLEAKKKKLEEISAYNFFSSMGKKMSEGLTTASEKLIELITD